MKLILPGIDILCTQAAAFTHTRFALVTNNAATTSYGTASRQALLQAGFNIIKLFSPEHGLTAQGDDGAYQHHHIDALTQLPVISLYSDHLAPTEEELDDVDAVIFDIPDVGCRFYTYLWTMTYVMEACAKFNKKLIVADRPNPIGGNLLKAEGPMLNEVHCASFIGRWNIPVRHSCTLGELAVYFAATRIPGLDLQVIKAANWNRLQNANEAGWHFTPTSPAISNIETAMLYPGMGLLEGINVHEGRGTETPFKIVGAPWIDGAQLNKAFMHLQLPGIGCGVINYTPAWGMYAGEICNGLQFTITHDQLFMPVKTGLALVQLIISMYPTNCTERLYHTVANPSGGGHLDKLTGVYQSFQKIKSGEVISTQLQQKEWAALLQPYALY